MAGRHQNKILEDRTGGPPCDAFVALMEGTGDGVYLADLSGRIQRINAAAEILTGATAGAAQGRACHEFLGCSDRSGCPVQRLAAGGVWVESVCRGSRADGRPLTLRLRARMVNDAVGRPAGHLAVFSEASLQESLQRKIVVYERLASLGELATSLVHEVGNPISVILGFARLLDQQGGRDPGGELRARIFQEAERCGKIVGQLLNYARSSSFDEPPGPLGLQGVVDEVLDLLSYRFRRRQVTAEVVWDPEAAWVRAGPGEMKQVFLNLYLNALDASEPGGTVRTVGRRLLREVTVGGGSLLSPVAEVVRDEWVEVRVEDRGHGLGAGDPERFFAPFATTKEAGGGLGLTVCRRIVEELGGTIRLEDNPGGGAVAVVELPACAPDTLPATA